MDALLKELPVHQGLARVFGALGQDGFWRVLVDTLRLLVPSKKNWRIGVAAALTGGSTASLLCEPAREEGGTFNIDVG